LKQNWKYNGRERFIGKSGTFYWFRSVQMNRKIVFPLVVLLAAVLACKASGNAASQPTNPTNIPTAVSPVNPNQSPAPTQASPLGAIVFQDDFSNPNSGWTVTDQDWIALDYADGEYRASVKKSYVASFSAFPNLQFDNVSIEADVRFITGPDSSPFGLLCRATANPDIQSGYQMFITPGGEATILKVTGVQAGQEKVLTSGKSPLIHTGTAVNHLRMDCSGDHITMYINGRQLVQVQDSDYVKGRVGFAFGADYTDFAPGFQVGFDNFIVRQISEGTSF
jgi:hypothetical protein